MAGEKRQEVQAWLQKADNDLRGARVDLAAEPPLAVANLPNSESSIRKSKVRSNPR
jgi:hypothetical protein